MAKRQGTLQAVGMTAPEYEDIEEAAEDYRAVRDKWMSLGAKAKEAKAILIKRMKEHGVTVYKYTDDDDVKRKAVIKENENVLVRKLKKKELDGDSDGGDDDDEDGDPVPPDASKDDVSVD